MITPEQLERRKKFIGSSDAAAILGLDPWKNAAAIWAEKTGRLEPDTSLEGREVIELGNWLEPLLLDRQRELLQPKADLRESEFQHTSAPMLAHPDAVFFFGACADALSDGLIIGPDERPLLVEAKTSGIVWRGSMDEWGESGTDQIPERVLIQVHCQAACLRSHKIDVREARVCSLLGGRGRVEYDVRLSDSLIDGLVNQLGEWWQKYVVTDTPPPNYETSLGLDAAKRLIRIEGKRREEAICGKLIAEFEEAKASRLQLEKVEEQVKSEILALLGDSEEAEIEGDVSRIVTARKQTRKEYIVKESTFSVLRIQKRK